MQNAKKTDANDGNKFQNVETKCNQLQQMPKSEIAHNTQIANQQ